MTGFVRYDQTVNGGEARAITNINGKIETAFYIKDLEATMEKIKEEGKTLGNRGTQHKANGYNSNGSMTIYYMTSVYRQMVLDYAKTGKDTYFTIIVENYDPHSQIGQQTTVLYDCNINSVVVAKIDVDSAALEEGVEFTFGIFDMLKKFDAPLMG